MKFTDSREKDGEGAQEKRPGFLLFVEYDSKNIWAQGVQCVD